MVKLGDVENFLFKLDRALYTADNAPRDRVLEEREIKNMRRRMKGKPEQGFGEIAEDVFNVARGQDAKATFVQCSEVMTELRAELHWQVQGGTGPLSPIALKIWSALQVLDQDPIGL